MSTIRRDNILLCGFACMILAQVVLFFLVAPETVQLWKWLGRWLYSERAAGWAQFFAALITVFAASVGILWQVIRQERVANKKINDEKNEWARKVDLLLAIYITYLDARTAKFPQFPDVPGIQEVLRLIRDQSAALDVMSAPNFRGAAVLGDFWMAFNSYEHTFTRFAEKSPIVIDEINVLHESFLSNLENIKLNLADSFPAFKPVDGTRRN